MALLLARNQLRESRDEQRIVHLRDMLQQFSEPPISKTLEALASERIDQQQQVLRPLDPDDAPDEMYDVMNFFETMGLLVNRGYLDKKDVWNEFGWWLFHFYADARPVVESEQKDDPAAFSNFSRLMRELEEIDQQESGGKLLHLSPDDIYRFYDAVSVSPPPKPIQHARKKKQAKSVKKSELVLPSGTVWAASWTGC